MGVIPPPHAGKQTQKKEKKSEKAERVGRFSLPQPKMSRGGRERPKKEEAPPLAFTIFRQPPAVARGGGGGDFPEKEKGKMANGRF